MRKFLVEKTQLTKEKIPSYYILAKKCPKIEPFIINNADCDDYFGSNKVQSHLNIDNTSCSIAPLEPKVEYTPLSFVDVSGKSINFSKRI